MPTGWLHTGTFPIRARIQGKARTQTSSRCTISTATAPALSVVLFLHAPLPGCPHPGVCRVTLSETYTNHRWTNAAPGPHAQGLSYETQGLCGGASSPDAGRVPPTSHPAPRGPELLPGSSSVRQEESRGSNNHYTRPLLQSYPPLAARQAGDQLACWSLQLCS